MARPLTWQEVLGTYSDFLDSREHPRRSGLHDGRWNQLLLIAIAGLSVVAAGCTGSSENGPDALPTPDNREEAPQPEAPALLTADLTGATESPGPGDPDASGTAVLQVDLTVPQLCYEVSVNGVDEPTAAHVHRGGPGIAGPIVVTLETPAGGSSTGCLDQSEVASVLGDIADSPNGFYVNVHNAAFPEGAVRGQLGLE